MAPTSKGVNPAPNYTVMMNRVQTQLEAQLKTVRSFLPARPAQDSKTTTTTAKATPSFSALASTLKPSPTAAATKNKQQTQRQNEDNIFADGRGQDPNAGLGFAAVSKRTSEKEKERSEQILRSRLLGRKRGAEDVSGRHMQRRGGGDESSDEEPGRGGLGRAKKRARREQSQEDEDMKDQPVPEIETLEIAPEKAGMASDAPLVDETPKEHEEEIVKDGQEAAPSRDGGSVPNGSEGTSDPQKKRKKKKKKKNATKET